MMINLPAIVLPAELVSLLREPSSLTPGAESPVNQMLRKSPGTALVLERAFQEFNEHRMGLEKIVVTLGWAHFRDRMTSVYLYKALHGTFPDKTDMDLVDDVKRFEGRFQDKGISGHSRLFLLGAYLKFFNIYLSQREDGAAASVVLPPGVDKALALSQVRSDRADWLILICWHFDAFFQTAPFLQMLKAGATYETLFGSLGKAQQQQMVSNLLSYGASIHESDPFLFERI